MTEVNTKLIAAAPDMVEVLKKVVAWEEKYPTGNIYGMYEIQRIAEQMSEIVKEASAALAKAGVI